MAHPYPTRFAEKARAESAKLLCSVCGDARDVVVMGMHQDPCGRCAKGAAIAPLLRKWFQGFNQRMHAATEAEEVELLEWVYSAKPTIAQLRAKLITPERVTIIHAETAMRIFEWATARGGVYGYEHGLIHLVIDPWCLAWKRTPSYVFCYYAELTYHPRGLTDNSHKLPQTKEDVIAHWRRFIQTTVSM